MKQKTLLLLPILAFLSPVAFSEGMYLEASIGESDFPGFDFGEGVPFSEDTGDSSFGLSFGYHFNEFLAVQGGYHNLGEYSYRIPFGEVGTADASGTYDFSTFSLALVPRYPLSDKFALFAEIGMHSYTADVNTASPEFVDGNFNSMETESSEVSDEKLYYQVGLEYRFSDRVFSKLKYGNFEIEDDSITNISVSLGLTF